MPNVQLTRDELQAIKQVILHDIELSNSDYDTPDYEDVCLYAYYHYRAAALHKINLVLRGED